MPRTKQGRATDSSSQKVAAARKRPRQERSRQMVDAILQAAALCFGELGYARTTTNKVAARAGVSIGSLYQYFPNKDALLTSLMETHHEQIHAVLKDALPRIADPTVPLEQGVRLLLEEMLAVHEADPAVTAALSLSVLRESPATDHPHEHKEEGSPSGPLMAALASRPDTRVGDPAATAAILRLVTGQLSRWIAHDAPASLSRDALVDEATRMLTRYLAV